jgi:hypothetical protein
MYTEISFKDLQEAEARYRGMFENAVEGIYQSTPDGHYLTVNAALARLYGLDAPVPFCSRATGHARTVCQLHSAAARVVANGAKFQNHVRPVASGQSNGMAGQR